MISYFYHFRHYFILMIFTFLFLRLQSNEKLISEDQVWIPEKLEK